MACLCSRSVTASELLAGTNRWTSVSSLMNWGAAGCHKAVWEETCQKVIRRRRKTNKTTKKKTEQLNQNLIKAESSTSYCVDTFFKMSTCSLVVGVIVRTWSLDKKKKDFSKRLYIPWLMQTPLDQSGTNMLHCFRQWQRWKWVIFGGREVEVLLKLCQC